MDYKSGDSIAIAWWGSRSAALFFDYVVPLSPLEIRFDSEHEGEPRMEALVPQILPPYLRDADTGSRGYDAWWSLTYKVRALSRRRPVDDQGSPRGEDELPVRESDLAEYSRSFATLLRSSSIADYSEYGRRKTLETGTEPALVLANIRIVNVNEVSWAQILEFRNDTDRVEKLRRLRRFIFAEYDGKPASFIKEDLEERIEQYEEVTKFWGFPTATGFLQIALTAESAAMVAAFSSALFGAPLAAAAAVGGSIALSKGLLEVAQRKREINLEREQNPISYLAEAKKVVNGS